MRSFFFLSMALLQLLGCVRPQETSGQAADTPAGIETETGGEGRKIIPPPSTIGDTRMFPRVFSGEGTTNIFEAWTMKFTLTYTSPFLPVTNDQVPWVNPEAYNESNGLFVTYILNGRQMSLNEPYIQVQYVAKSIPGYGSIDSVFYTLDHYFLYDPGSRVFFERQEQLTKSGLKAWVKSYQTPTYQNKTGKNMALAYIDYDKDYWVAFGFTTIEEVDFRNFYSLFEKLLSSFALYGG